MLVFDLEGKIRLVNRAAETLLGARESEVIGRAFTQVLEVPSQAGESARPHELLRPKSFLDLVGRGGERIPLAICGSPLYSPSAELEAIVCVCSDLREQRNLELELRHAQKLESIGQLAAGIAHEINTPVQFIGDSVCFLQDAFGDLERLIDALMDCIRREQAGAAMDSAQCLLELEEQIDFEFLRTEVPSAVQRIMQGVGRVAGIVRAMKTFAHPGTAEMSVCNVNECIETTLTVAKSEYKYVADIERDLGAIPEVICNQGDIHQVLLNLIVNAAHAIEQMVKTTGKRGKIGLRTRQLGEQVVIEISDTGGGIPSEIQGRVFEPFFTTKPAGKGTGQGLSIARRIMIEKHGGAIEFTSVHGQGTTFTLRLPITGKDATAARGRAP